MIETRQKSYNKPKSAGCHCSDPKPDGTCCNLICFERPNYFCGHLLTDTDLSKEQQYVIEKHKLYNRTLHGWGVVCGLGLMCADQECCGSIVIDEGYAIDDCGNDLVVCEPLRFDVVSLLKEKGWVTGDAIYDPCAPEDEEDNCEYTQCFYVTICYEEESRDFTTPFVAGCRPTLTECEPTRIREAVSFNVLDKLPEENGWLKDLVNRLAGCFSIFSTGPFARALNEPGKKRMLMDICALDSAGFSTESLNNLFCELRALLLLYLQKHPDKYNCKLADEIGRIRFPDPSNNEAGYAQQLKDAFSNLLRLAFQQAISCALGELVPRCPGPKHAGCVVLGTVEVKGGCVTHVCNCPRKYVWSFANFFQVLLATMGGGFACEDKEEATAVPVGTRGDPAATINVSATYPGRTEDQEQHERHVCCKEFDASCEQILSLINIDPKFLQYAGTEVMRAFAVMAKSFRSLFNFTDASMYSPAMLWNMNATQFRNAAKFLGIENNIRYEEAAVSPAPLHPFEEFARIGLARMGAPDTTIVVERDKNVVVNAYAVPSSLQTEGMKELKARVASAETTAQQAKAQVDKLVEELKGYTRGQTGGTQSESETQKRIKQILSSISEPETPAAKKRSSKRGRRTQTPEGEEGENG